VQGPATAQHPRSTAGRHGHIPGHQLLQCKVQHFSLNCQQRWL